VKFNVHSGRATCEACGATWNLGTNSTFAAGPRETLSIWRVEGPSEYRVLGRVHVAMFNKFNFFLTESTLHHHRRDQSADVVREIIIIYSETSSDSRGSSVSTVTRLGAR
jgi:hypothetical protein